MNPLYFCVTECPGGSSNPCSGHGSCRDGHDRDGQCDCEQGFTGTACELCTAGRYGLDCEGKINSKYLLYFVVVLCCIHISLLLC